MAFDLSSGFNTLTLRSEANSQNLEEFTLFTSLPIELRLKIITHALPAHQTLTLLASTLIADSETGLYLIGSIAPPPLPCTIPTFGGYIPLSPPNWYIAARSLNLLLVNHEMRDHYISQFPCTLPTLNNYDFQVRGKIRFSPLERIEFSNFNSSVFLKDLVEARRQGWRVQRWVGEVQELVVPMVIEVLGWVEALEAFGKLRKVTAVMWKDFSVNVEGDVKSQLLGAMEFRLKEVEQKLQERNKDNPDYVMPKFELVESR